MSDLREAFEAWFSKWGMTPKAVIESLREGEEYPQDSMREVNAAWHAWQAALSANGGEAVGWLVSRKGDGTFPRFYFDKGLAEDMVKEVELPPSATMSPVYTHPAPPSVAVPEGWDDDAAKQLEQARQLQEAQYGSSAQTLTAAPSPDHIADAGKVVPIGYLTNQAVARLQSDKRLNGEHLYAFKPDDLSKFQAVCLAPTVNESLTIEDFNGMCRIVEAVSQMTDGLAIDQCHIDRAREIVQDAARLRTAGDEGEE